jgi:hypothetical protein
VKAARDRQSVSAALWALSRKVLPANENEIHFHYTQIGQRETAHLARVIRPGTGKKSCCDNSAGIAALLPFS